MIRKRITSTLLSAGLALGSFTCMLPAAASAETETIETISNDNLRQFIQIGPMFFRCDLEHAVLVSCNKDYEGKLEIPSYVQGKPVTTLGYACLADCYGITELTIPETVAVICNNALYGLNVKELTFPLSLQSIGRHAVYNIYSLEKVTFRSPWFLNGMDPKLSRNFFYDGGCEGQYNYEMKICGYKGSDAEKLAQGCFEFCDETTEEGSGVITVDGTWKDGFCFEVDTENNEAKLIGCDIKNIKTIGMDIPSEVNGVPVTEIGDNALRGAVYFDIAIPDTVRRIGDNALGYCLDAVEIVIPESVEYIGSNSLTSAYSYVERVKFMSADTKIDRQNFIAFDLDPSGGTFFNNSDCVIYGKAGSDAEKIAAEKGLEFVLLEDPEVVYGDANLDGNVNISDSVAIMQAVTIPEKAALSAEAAKNADVSDTGDGITIKDALTVQNYMLGLVTSLPE